MVRRAARFPTPDAESLYAGIAADPGARQDFLDTFTKRRRMAEVLTPRRVQRWRAAAAYEDGLRRLDALLAEVPPAQLSSVVPAVSMSRAAPPRTTTATTSAAATAPTMARPIDATPHAAPAATAPAAAPAPPATVRCRSASSPSPARPASANAGTRPANDTSPGSSNTADRTETA